MIHRSEHRIPPRQREHRQAISRKFASIDVTRMSTPSKKSRARWLPIMASVAIAALTMMATCGVRNTGCTAATARGKMPSSAQANIRRDTASSIAGRSLASATAAAAMMTRSRTGQEIAEQARRRQVPALRFVRDVLHGTAWYTAAVNSI